MTHSNARLTIGMPIYNGAQDLARVLDNLLAQSYQDFKIILSNNGSQDDTGLICDDYAMRDSRITVYHQPVTLNATENFCFVRDKADTDYFAWAAHDDFRDTDYFEKLVLTLDAQPEAILAFGDVIQIAPDTGNRERLVIDFVQQNKNTFSRLWWTATHQMHYLYGVWRTKALQAIDWRHTIWSHDTTLLMAATALGRFSYCAGVHLHYLDNRHPFFPKNTSFSVILVKSRQIMDVVGKTMIAVYSVRQAGWAVVAGMMILARTLKQAIIFAKKRL